MKRIKIDLKNYVAEEIKMIAREISAGKVVVLPTDTIHGLSAVVTDKKAIRKIYRIKKRKPEQQKHLILLVKSFCMIRRYCYLSPKQYNYLRERWVDNKRALTVVLRGRRDYLHKRGIALPEIISADDGLAVRRPNSKFLLALLEEVDAPIVSTSLNITGKPDLKNLSEIDSYFTDAKPDIIIDAGVLPKRKPSRLEDLRDMKKIKIFRK